MILIEVKGATQGTPMVLRQIFVSVGAIFVAISVHASSAQALSMKECGAKYKAAKGAGTLGGMKWNDFRKAQCGAEATAEPTPSAAAPPPTRPPNTSAAKPSQAPVAPGNAVFPSTLAPKYSGESAGKARMHTCLDQYHANKANGANGGLKWIEKGGGYYSECNKRLKGAA
jgi:hypothetical protein